MCVSSHHLRYERLFPFVNTFGVVVKCRTWCDVCLGTRCRLSIGHISPAKPDCGRKKEFCWESGNVADADEDDAMAPKEQMR